MQVVNEDKICKYLNFVVPLHGIMACDAKYYLNYELL